MLGRGVYVSIERSCIIGFICSSKFKKLSDYASTRVTRIIVLKLRSHDVLLSQNGCFVISAGILGERRSHWVNLSVVPLSFDWWTVRFLARPEIG